MSCQDSLKWAWRENHDSGDNRFFMPALGASYPAGDSHNEVTKAGFIFVENTTSDLGLPSFVMADEDCLHFYPGRAPKTRALLEQLVDTCNRVLKMCPDEGSYQERIGFEWEKWCKVERDRFQQECKRQSGVKPRRAAYVYLMRNNRNGLYKIGYSSNPKHRESTLQSEEPEVELIWSTPGTEEDEKAMHAYYDQKRVRGEWFKLTKRDVRVICR